EVFRLLVQRLAEALAVRYAFIGEWDEARPDHVRTVAVWSGEGHREPFDYCLEGTPCENVVGQRLCLYESEVQRLFPNDHQLVEMKVQSYCGMPLCDRAGKPLGLLVVMDVKPMSDVVFIEDILSVFAGRAANEIERNRIDQERIASLDLLHNVMETVPDIIFRLDLQGNLVGWNKQLELATGLNAEELNNKPALAFVPEAEHAQTAAAIQRAFDEGDAELEGHLLEKTGRLIPYHWTGAVLKDHTGLVIGITGVGRDISERKWAERTLAEDRRRLQDIFDAMFGFVALCTRDGRILEINQTPLKAGNVTKCDVMGRYFWDIPWWSSLPETQVCLKDWMSRAAQGEMVRGELIFRMSDGRLATADGTFGPLRDPTGAITHVVGFGVDISDRKQAELELEQALDRLKLTQFSVDQALDGFLWIGSNGNIIQVNQAACGMLEYSLQELMSMTVHDIAPNLPQESWRSHWKELKARGSWTYETQYWSQNGCVLDAEVTVNYLRYKDQEYCCAILRDIGQRKRADAALRANEERLDLVLRATNDGVWDWDILTGDEYLSPQWKALLGFADQELSNDETSFFHRLHPDDVEQVKAALEAHFQGPSPYDLDVRLQHRDGHYQWFRARGEAIRDSEGRPYRMVGSITDITERKQAAEALRESEEQFSKAFHEAAIGMALVSLDGHWLQVNQALCGMLGYSPKELGAMTVRAVTHQGDRYAYSRFVNGVLSGELRTFHLETRYLHKQGHVIWAILSLSLIRNTDQSPRHLILQIQDVSERRLAEAAVRESETMHRALFEQSPLMCFLLDAEGTMLKVNRLGAAALGYDVSELLGRSVLMVFPEEMRTMARQHIADCVSGPTDAQHSWELQKQRKDGSRLWVRDFARLLIDRDGRSTVLISCEDITDRRHVEDALRLTQYAVDQAGDQIFLIGRDGYFLDVNESACRRLKYAKQELLTMSVMDIDPDFPPEIWDTFWEEFQRSKQVRLETRHRSKTGEIYPVEVTANYFMHNGRELDYAIVRDITERKQAEEALRQSEVRFRSLFEQSPVAYQSLDKEGRFIDVNPMLCQMLGYHKEDLIGRAFGDLWADEVRCDFPTLFDRFKHAGHVHNELALRRRDESIIHVVINGRIQRDQHGEFIRTHCILTDITERTKTEQALRQSEGRLNEAQRLAHIGSWELNLNRNRLSWSDEVHRIFEVDRECFSGSYEAFLSAVHPDDRSLVDRTYITSVRDKTPYDIEHRLLMPDGRVKYVHECCETIYDAHGVPLRSFGTIQDVTERRRVEEALRVSLERFDLAVAASQDGLWDAQIIADDPFNPSNPIYYSPRMKDIMGVEQGPATDVIGAWASLVHPEDRGRIFAALTAHLRQRVPYDVEYRIVKPIGDVRWIAARGQAQWDAADRPVRMSGSFADITERKQAEVVLRQRKRDLAAALDERERISQDLHDGILQSLYATGLVLESCRPMFVRSCTNCVEGAELVAVFDQVIGQLNRVMSEVRNFIAGIESQVLHGADLATAIQAMVQNLVATGISCQATIDENATKKVSTEHAVHLLNITREAMSNSIRHGHATQILVSLVQSTSSIRLSISDNGRGFNLDKVSGTGHGLSNMAARARKINGQLTVRARPHYGTSIVIDLPEGTAHDAHNA
ncbi:MAG: PAS domain S-box protein, partial [Nitrospira sp.]|nr:PAS domain S-box protein [Nitrospira sp.]